jgi:DUF2075 family protein
VLAAQPGDLEVRTEVDESIRLNIRVRWVWDKEQPVPDNWTIAIHNLSYIANDEIYAAREFQVNYTERGKAILMKK